MNAIFPHDFCSVYLYVSVVFRKVSRLHHFVPSAMKFDTKNDQCTICLILMWQSPLRACVFSLYLIFICSKFILQIIVDLQIKKMCSLRNNVF